MKVLLFANTEWYLYNFRLALARALRAAGAEVVLISPSGPYGARLQAEGFRWIALPMARRSLNPFRELLLLLHLARLYHYEKPDIVHHFTIKCVIYGSLAARLAGIRRRINAVAGLGYVFISDELRARLLKPFVRTLMKLALGGKQSRLVLQNADDQVLFEQAGLVSAVQTVLIPGSGVNTDRFQPIKEERPRHRVFRIFFAARLLWDKGIQELVDAVRQLKADGMSIECLLAGAPDPGNPAAVPDDTVQSWHAEGLVTVLGHVDNMVEWLHQVDVAVMPSYREGMPKSLVEAAACGLPIITTDAPGCRQIVEHGINGLLVPCKDAVALAAAIRLLYGESDKRHAMGKAGRMKVLADFSEDVVLTKTLDVYRELMPDQFCMRLASKS